MNRKNWISSEQFCSLERNWESISIDGAVEDDSEPVVLVRMLDGNGRWLLSRLAGFDPDHASGICDMSDCPAEVRRRLIVDPEDADMFTIARDESGVKVFHGAVSLKELAKVKGPTGKLVEVDHTFGARGTMADYVQHAREEERLVLEWSDE